MKAHAHVVNKVRISVNTNDNRKMLENRRPKILTYKLVQPFQVAMFDQDVGDYGSLQIRIIYLL